MQSGALKRQSEELENLMRTPRCNRDLPQVLGGFRSLAEGLDYAARGATGFNFYSPRGALQHVLPYAELRRRAHVHRAASFCRWASSVVTGSRLSPRPVPTSWRCSSAASMPGSFRARCPTRCISAARSPISTASPACCRRPRPDGDHQRGPARPHFRRCGQGRRVAGADPCRIAGSARSPSQARTVRRG